MLVAGSTDGIYAIRGVREGEGESPAVERVLDADDVFRVRSFDGIDGLFAAAASGLYHSPDGREWSPLPAAAVYAVAASPAGDRLYAGTRPTDLFVADVSTALPTAPGGWKPVAGFRDLRDRHDWGIPRHDGISQVRSLRTHPDAPDRVVAGVEVGGVHVSDDGGATWESRCVDGFDAPHTDDVHHLALDGAETVVASTGSGLYRSTDAGRTWDRLDRGHSQRYFREAFVHDGAVYAGGAPSSSSSWAEDDDHALFECRDGDRLERVPSPAPEEVAVGWCAVDDAVVAATHDGTLLRRGDDGWTHAGSIPTPEGTVVRYLPLAWVES